MIPDSLQLLLDDGVIDGVLQQIKSGKEADVYLVRKGELPLAAKVYKARDQRNFKNNVGYREGRNFRNSRDMRAMQKREDPRAFEPLLERCTELLTSCDDPALEARAVEHVTRLADDLGHVGVITLELFVVGDALLANEFAPRVHNSGHWTIEGAATSQFENHLRAILGLPLGRTEAREPTALVNLIGRLPDTREVLSWPDTHLHLYAKHPRAGRKLGHVTLRAAHHETLHHRVEDRLDRGDKVVVEHHIDRRDILDELLRT